MSLVPFMVRFMVPFMVPIRIALVALLFFALPAQAQLYKWVDANGRVQYSDRKPAEDKRPQEVRNTVSSVGSQTTTGGKTPAELDKEFRERREKQAESQQKQQQASADQKQKSENCDAARRNLAALQSGQRIARFDASGEKTYIDDAGRAQEVERNRRLVEANCK
jgi:FtsZ-interacting cell division protein ZipA